MSSETFAIVAWALRASGVPAAGTVTGRSHLVHEPPQPAQEPCDPFGARGSPLHVLVGGPQEEDVEPYGVGAVQAHELVGSHDVALRLRHLHAAELHPALVEDLRERLAEADEAHLVHDLHEEARVEQVAGRWSMPPMYCEIGHQKSAAARSNGATSECGST